VERAVVLVGLIAVFGASLLWPPWMMDISPFTQIPRLPGGAVSAEPLAWLCGIALALGVTGLLGLRRRDLGDFGPSGLAARIRTYIEESLG
jgi:putative exporter of polyketide antibiotics